MYFAFKICIWIIIVHWFRRIFLDISFFWSFQNNSNMAVSIWILHGWPEVLNNIFLVCCHTNFIKACFPQNPILRTTFALRGLSTQMGSQEPSGSKPLPAGSLKWGPTIWCWILWHEEQAQHHHNSYRWRKGSSCHGLHFVGGQSVHQTFQLGLMWRLKMLKQRRLVKLRWKLKDVMCLKDSWF